MKKELLDILACPVCKKPLGLTVTEEKQGEIVSGVLRCDSCRHDYQIKDTIPDLLPPKVN
jgi:uncharacterized protein YbaR (Trm112 family)